MFSINLRSAALLLTVVGVLALIGCEADQISSNSNANEHPTAAYCDKCKAMWVRVPEHKWRKGGQGIVYRSRKVMTCPDCESMVSNFFKTGKLEHTCKTCGGTIEPCESHPF